MSSLSSLHSFGGFRERGSDTHSHGHTVLLHEPLLLVLHRRLVKVASTVLLCGEAAHFAFGRHYVGIYSRLTALLNKVILQLTWHVLVGEPKTEVVCAFLVFLCSGLDWIKLAYQPIFFVGSNWGAFFGRCHNLAVLTLAVCSVSLKWRVHARWHSSVPIFFAINIHRLLTAQQLLAFNVLSMLVRRRLHLLFHPLFAGNFS